MSAAKKANVYFISLRLDEPKSLLKEKITRITEAVSLGSLIEEKDYVAIKIHFGERKNDTHIPPHCVRPIVECIKKNGGVPFLTDTNVLYRSQRSNSVSHLTLIENHGFSIRKIGAPVIIGDGLLGDSEITVKIPGKIYTEVSLARDIMLANALVAISHVTGHLSTGLGATVKNLGMGIASRKGKLRQHSAMKPQIMPEKCTGCEECLRWCPEDTIKMEGEIATIIAEGCIGCGECLAVCRFNAVRYNWGVESEDLQKRMAEHALGAIIGRRNKAIFYNFLTSITKDCDCFEIKQTPIMEDIGVVVSTDPVAVDKASLDLIFKKMGKNLSELSYPHLEELTQLQHGEEIGLGTLRYKLKEVK